MFQKHSENKLVHRYLYFLLQIIFEAKVGVGQYSDIAIDDIFIDEGDCGKGMEGNGHMFYEVLQNKPFVLSDSFLKQDSHRHIGDKFIVCYV